MASRSITSVTGREIKLACCAFPRWAFTLQFGQDSWLRDQTQNSAPGPNALGLTEFMQLTQLYFACNGPYGEFYYSDPDDSSRAGAPCAGAVNQTNFSIYIPWGTGPFTPEMIFPCQGVNSISTVYGNGNPISPTEYTVDTVNSVIEFSSPPNATITCDLSFYYRCRFLDDNLSFSEWATNLWELKELRFESVKP